MFIDVYDILLSYQLTLTTKKSLAFVNRTIFRINKIELIKIHGEKLRIKNYYRNNKLRFLVIFIRVLKHFTQ